MKYKYEKESEISYSLGAFATIELLNNKLKYVKKIIISKNLKMSNDINNVLQIAKKHKIDIITDDESLKRISKKDNCYVMGLFEKYNQKLDAGNQIVLHNPSDMGNIGTIMRTMLGFGITNLAIIKPSVDYFDPKVIRASMGAIFSLNIECYDNFTDYEKNNKIKKYLFMLGNYSTLQQINAQNEKYALIFGNEAHGLPMELEKYGTPVFIKHNNKIDSLNLAISVAIATYHFSK